MQWERSFKACHNEQDSVMGGGEAEKKGEILKKKIDLKIPINYSPALPSNSQKLFPPK